MIYVVLKAAQVVRFLERDVIHVSNLPRFLLAYRVLDRSKRSNLVQFAGRNAKRSVVELSCVYILSSTNDFPAQRSRGSYATFRISFASGTTCFP